MNEFVDGYPNEVVAVSESTIGEQPEALRAFLDALIRAGELIQEDPDRAVQVVAESSGTDIDVIQEGFDFMEDTIAYDARVNPEVLQWNIDRKSKRRNSS